MLAFMILHTYGFATSKIQHIDVNKLYYSIIKIFFYTTEWIENILFRIPACSTIPDQFYKLNQMNNRTRESKEILS